MKVSEAKTLIGKFVRFKQKTWQPYEAMWEYGQIDEIKGKNIYIGDDWKWLPNITRMEEYAKK